MKYTHVETRKNLPEWVTIESLAEFLHSTMKPYEDRVADIRRALDYALSSNPGEGGFIVLASRNTTLEGAAVILDTGMSGYIPEHVLLFIAVRPELRGQGIGGQLMDRVKQQSSGDIKLHVEHDNPARRLYERQGFTSKYLEMRWSSK